MTSTASPARLAGRFVVRERLQARERDAMFALLASHFSGVDRQTFENDLLEKSLAILLESDDGVLRGFSTLLVYRSDAAGRPVTVVYSGDTIVERASWGSSALPLTWLRAVRALAPQDGTSDLYWLLLTSGYRTYRFLPVFFRDYYPRAGHALDGDAALVDTLGRERFGSLFDPARGIVRFDRPQVLVAELLDVPDGRRQDGHISFFLERNPGHVKGDELVCLTRIADDNLTLAGRRYAMRVQELPPEGGSHDRHG